MMPQPKKTWLLTSLYFTLLYGVLLHGTATCREVHPSSSHRNVLRFQKSRLGRLTIFVEDLYLFHEMEPDDRSLYSADLEPARMLTSNFLIE